MRHTGITIIVLAFVALATLYSVVTPLGEGPDEPGHAAYVFFLAREGRLPIQQAERAASEVPGEGHQPPLAYVLAAPLLAWLPLEQRQIDLPGNARFTWAGGDELNAVAHGSRELWPWRGAVLAWHLARLASVGCGAATVVFTYLAAQSLAKERQKTKDERSIASGAAALAPDPWSLVPLLAAALVAFNPQFLFTAALVTNDALLAALSAALLWLVVRTGRKKIDQRPKSRDQRDHAFLVVRPWAFGRIGLALPQPIGHAIALGLMLGLALLTKQSALLLAPVALLSVLEQSWRIKWTRQDGKKSFSVSACQRVSVSHVLLFAITALLLCGWWYARNWRLYGDPLGLAAFQAEFATQPFDPARLNAWIGALKQLHSSFWARFGWMNVRPPGWAIGVFVVLEVVASAGWLRRRLRARRGGHGGAAVQEHVAAWRSWLKEGRWALLLLPLLALAWIISFALTAGLVAWQGRLLFPALPAIAILLAIGMQNVKCKMKNSFSRSLNFAFYILQFVLFILALWLPFGVIRPAYPLQALPEQAALQRLGTPVYGRYGLRGDPGAELRGWRLGGGARAGQTTELTLIWHALGRQNRDWTVFVHLVDPVGRIAAWHNQPPRGGAFPMTQWVAGDWVEDRHALALPADLAPGAYMLRVGLFDEQTGRRTGVFTQKGTLIGDYLELGVITVRG